MTKEKGFPSKTEFARALVEKYAHSTISILAYIVIGFLITLGFLINTNYFFFRILSLVLNLFVLFVVVVSKIFFKQLKERSVYNKYLHIALISVLGGTTIIAILNFILQFTSKSMLIIGLPVISVLLTILASQYIEIYKFTKNNYELLKEKQSESYDLLEKSKLYLETKSEGSVVFKFCCLLKFALSCVILIFAAVTIHLIEMPKIFLPSQYISNIAFILMLLELPLIIAFLIMDLAKHCDIEKTMGIPYSLLLFLLASTIVFKFFACENEINNFFHIANMIFACTILGLICCKKLLEDNSCLSILDDVKSSFYKKELDSIMLDEPIDNIEAIGSLHIGEIHRLHNILEKTDSNVPLTISYMGKWGCGKSSIIKTLSVQLSKINRYSFTPLNYNDKYKKRYFTINLDLMKFESPIEIIDYIYGYIGKLCKVFLCNMGKSVDEYFKNILELLSGSDNKSISLLSKIANNITRKKFSTIEDIRFNFQETINRLIKKSKRAGIILFIDDIDRLHKKENKKIYYLLKEFFNIYGFKTVILGGYKKDSTTSKKSEYELEKFINVEFDINCNSKDNSIFDKTFEQYISIAARALNLDDDIEKQSAFFRFDKKLRDNTFTACINEILSSKNISFKSKDKGTRLLNSFTKFLEALCHNPRKYKKILRKAYLENTSIVESLANEYEKESVGFKLQFAKLIS